MTAYYNENDPKTAEWLRTLIHYGAIAPGDVDERSIEDVTPNDLTRYTQCHFFAGIGGWSYALRIAGWPDDRPVWTGSCPCQPFSDAGQKGGTEDKRHLWPDFFRLIRERRPSTVFGEQVASKDGLAWLDIVSADLEGAGYAVGAADLCAAGVEAPHIRQRLWFVADSARNGRREERSDAGRVAAGDSAQGRPAGLESSGQFGELGHAHDAGLQGRVECRDGADEWPIGASSVGGNPWHSCDWVPCTDGKSRPIEPGTFPLAHGVPGRVGLLRGYGNAIVPQVAATFILASLTPASL